jgi:hypothetical protein
MSGFVIYLKKRAHGPNKTAKRKRTCRKSSDCKLPYTIVMGFRVDVKKYPQQHVGFGPRKQKTKNRKNARFQAMEAGILAIFQG